jgi:hypothetical protein
MVTTSRTDSINFGISPCRRRCSLLTSALLESNGVIVALTNHIEEPFQSGVTGNWKQNAASAAKEKASIIGDDMPVSGNLDLLGANTLRHVRRDGGGRVRIIERKSGRQLNRNVILHGPRVVKIDVVLVVRRSE